MVMSCLADKPDKAYLTGTMRLMEKVPVYFDSHIFDLLEQLTNLTGTGKCPGLSLDELKTMTETLLANPAVKGNEVNELVLTHVKGLIALQMNDKAAALSLFADVLKMSGAPETGLLQTSLLASHGFYAEALAHLADSEKLLGITPVIVEGVLSTHDYPMEINRLRLQIQQDMGQPPIRPTTVDTPQSKP
jgi:hypothetical protein